MSLIFTFSVLLCVNVPSGFLFTLYVRMTPPGSCLDDGMGGKIESDAGAGRGGIGGGVCTRLVLEVALLVGALEA